MERLKPLNDFVFKKTFGEEETKSNLIALLNAILGKNDKEKLVSLEILSNKELTPELIDDKTSIIDVRAKTEDGTQIDIEVQLTNQHNMDKRTLWYWGQLFAEGIKKGDDYKKLAKVITINILDFEYIDIPDKFHTTFHLREDEVTDYMLTDIVEIHFIEVEKFRKLQNKNIKEDKLQRWLSFFRQDISEEELKELMEMDADIRRAEEKIEHLASDPKALALYKARENSLHERANMISSAMEEGMAKGRLEGMAKGRLEGMAKGRLEGMAKGRLEGRLEVARQLLLMGLDKDAILKATGLLESQIEQLYN